MDISLFSFYTVNHALFKYFLLKYSLYTILYWFQMNNLVIHHTPSFLKHSSVSSTMKGRFPSFLFAIPLCLLCWFLVIYVPAIDPGPTFLLFLNFSLGYLIQYYNLKNQGADNSQMCIPGAQFCESPTHGKTIQLVAFILIFHRHLTFNTSKTSFPYP